MTAWLNCKILTLLLKHLFEILIQDYHDFLNQEIKSFLYKKRNNHIGQIITNYKLIYRLQIIITDYKLKYKFLKLINFKVIYFFCLYYKLFLYFKSIYFLIFR